MARRATNDSLLGSVERIVAGRYDTAVVMVDEIRTGLVATTGREPSPDRLTDEIVRRYSRQLGTVAALAGGAAATPGTGTGAAVAATGADMAYTLGRLAEMVLAIGVAYGHDAASLEERRAWVLAVLSMGEGAVTGVEGLAGRIGAKGGARLLGSLTSSQLRGVDTKLVTRLASDKVAGRLGRLLPFGIGAGIGAAGNVLIVRSVAKTARQFFGEHSPPPAPLADDDVIDVEVVDDDRGGSVGG